MAGRGEPTVSDDMAAARDNLMDSVNELNRKSTQVQRLVTKLGTASDNDAMRGRLREAVGNAKEHVTQVTGDLRRLKRVCEGTNTVEMDIARTCEQAAQKAIGKFRDVTAESVRKERQLLDAERERRAIEGDNEEAPMLQSVLVERLDDFDYNAQIAQQRNEEIEDIERTVVEVFEIFKELDVMVNDQDQKIQAVDENVDRAAERVTDGNKQLRTAKRHANRSRKLKMWLLLISFIALLIIVLWGSGKM